MLSKRTIIGIIAGSIIIALGAASIFTHIGVQEFSVNDSFPIGEKTTYRLNAPQHTNQNMTISGDAYDITLSSPADGLQIPTTSHKNEVSLDWVHLADGESVIEIQNTGQSELNVTGTVYHTSDPIFISYDILVIISGMVIIGFSAGFSLRKPKGF